MLKSLKRFLDWRWLTIVLLVVNLGIVFILAENISKQDSDISTLQQQKGELIEANEILYKTIVDYDKHRGGQQLLINTQREYIERQQMLIERYKATLQWLKDNVLPQPEPEYDPDTIT